LILYHILNTQDRYKLTHVTPLFYVQILPDTNIIIYTIKINTTTHHQSTYSHVSRTWRTTLRREAMFRWYAWACCFLLRSSSSRYLKNFSTALNDRFPAVIIATLHVCYNTSTPGCNTSTTVFHYTLQHWNTNKEE